MTRSRLGAVLVLAAQALVVQASAQDGPAAAGEACPALCRLWRSVSGGPAAPAVTAPPPAPYVMSIPPDEVEPPVPGRIVATRGVVMAETAAERAKRKRDYSAMQRSIPATQSGSVVQDLKPTSAAR